MTTGSRMNTSILEQKSRQIEPTQQENEEILERSYQEGETRRSVVQIRTTPPTASFCGCLFCPEHSKESLLG